jgi:primosomal protein N' (replication factor Y)
MSIVQVALDVPLTRLFDYRIDPAMQSEAEPPGPQAVPEIGRLVSVPFGKGGSGQKIGLVLGASLNSDQPSEKLKPISHTLDNIPLLPQDWIALCEFCARYYQHPLGEVVHFALPPFLRRGKMPRAVKDKRTTDAVTASKPHLLAEQQSAVDSILAAPGFETFLLHGITGSGKTEVYLHAIEAILLAGKQALMLVPEIALTPQLEQRVAARFPAAHIVSANSGIGDAARSRAFLDALSGKADIVLGTRLAVFMPMPRLGLIVIDEEHDGSFKQQEGLRYSARDVAIFRAKQQNVAIVLGSATPALETFHHARTGRYRLLELSKRAVAESLPTVSTVDTRREKLQDGMSQALLDAIAIRLQRGEQSLIFLNRRGYAPVLACTACGWISRCRRCAANLVVHLADKRLRCHHCGLEAGIPHHCPDCGNIDIHPFGRGTQRLEQSLNERFPDARILRVDRDSADSPKKWRALLETIHAGDVDILVGTQMLAKGHDFPKLTLVGAVGADAALFAADFRAPERLFSQLMQVGGRSGRAALAGEVLIQTEYPDHALYRALADHDYTRFASAQLKEREQAGFPPFTYQAMLRADAPNIAQSTTFLEQARDLANALANGLEKSIAEITVYDPVPMRLSRLANRERAQLLIESHNRPRLQNFLVAWTTNIRALKSPRDLRWHIDVDPMEF